MSPTFVSYFDLKNPEKPLPKGSKFVDSYDNTTYYVAPGEILSDFIKKVKASREEKNLPAFEDAELRTYIVTFLAETCPKEDLGAYFVKKATVPEFGKVVTLAKQAVMNRINGQETSYQLRQSRATACVSCPLNLTQAAPIPGKLSSAIAGAANLEDIVMSQTEEKLGTCGMCGCELKNKIRLSLVGALAALTPDEIRVALTKIGPKLFGNCWIMTESLQDGRLAKVVASKTAHSGPKTQDMLNKFFADKLEKIK